MSLDFAESFGVLTAPDGLKREPFRWQVRLFEAMASGLIPSALDLPKGLGKTSVMAVWLLALASGAPLPRRLIYIVDRRAVVDQASAEAVRIAERATAVRSIAAALGLSAPLAVSTLRGQQVDNRAWTNDPAAPAIIVGTVDMVGSRLLFEGYGVSRRMRPMHAGLLGTDALMLLDEAHLVPPFARLLDDAAALADSARQAPRPALRVMALSATLGASNTAPFRLADADLEDPPVRRRLVAAKSLERREITGNLAEAMAATVGALIVDRRAIRTPFRGLSASKRAPSGTWVHGVPG